MHPDTLEMLGRTINDDRMRDAALRRIRHFVRNCAQAQATPSTPGTHPTVASPPVLIPVPPAEPGAREAPPVRIAS